MSVVTQKVYSYLYNTTSTATLPRSTEIARGCCVVVVVAIKRACREILVLPTCIAKASTLIVSA